MLLLLLSLAVSGKEQQFDDTEDDGVDYIDDAALSSGAKPTPKQPQQTTIINTIVKKNDDKPSEKTSDEIENLKKSETVNKNIDDFEYEEDGNGDEEYYNLANNEIKVTSPVLAPKPPTTAAPMLLATASIAKILTTAAKIEAVLSSVSAATTMPIDEYYDDYEDGDEKADIFDEEYDEVEKGNDAKPVEVVIEHSGKESQVKVDGNTNSTEVKQQENIPTLEQVDKETNLNTNKLDQADIETNLDDKNSASETAAGGGGGGIDESDYDDDYEDLIGEEDGANYDEEEDLEKVLDGEEADLSDKDAENKDVSNEIDEQDDSERADDKVVLAYNPNGNENAISDGIQGTTFENKKDIKNLSLQQLMRSPALIAGILGGILISVITAALIITYLTCRVRNRDKGSYLITTSNDASFKYAYIPAPTREYFA